MKALPPFGLHSPTDQTFLRFFVNAVDIASEASAASWGVTPCDGGVRLNAGHCEALTLWHDGARVLVKKVELPKDVRSRGVAIIPGYVSSPGSVMLEIDGRSVRSIARLLQKVRAAHSAAIAVSVKRALNPGARRGHSDDAVRALSEWAARALPLPTFKRPKVATSRWEGAIKESRATTYERSAAARAACLDHHGCQCVACGLLFEQRYGPDAMGLIHVHHVRAVSSRGRRYKVNPVADLRPVCPNCHAVIHSVRSPLTIAQVRLMLKRQAS